MISQTKLWAVWGDRDWEGTELDSIWDEEKSAIGRQIEMMKDIRGYGFDDVFYTEIDLNTPMTLYAPIKPQKPRHNKSYKDWENK